MHRLSTCHLSGTNCQRWETQSVTHGLTAQVGPWANKIWWHLSLTWMKVAWGTGTLNADWNGISRLQSNGKVNVSFVCFASGSELPWRWERSPARERFQTHSPIIISVTDRSNTYKNWIVIGSYSLLRVSRLFQRKVPQKLKIWKHGWYVLQCGLLVIVSCLGD